MWTLEPEHTGENRCWPCTVVNLLTAAVISAVVLPYSLVLSGTLFSLSLLSITFVGYLIPGTPYLTRRFLPDRVLGWFGKPPSGSVSSQADEDGFALDELLTAGILDTSADGTLSLSASFEDSWSSRIDALRGDERAQRDGFASMVGVATEEVTFEPIDTTGALEVRIVDGPVSQWLSRAALLADIAASSTLARTDYAWDRLAPQERHTVLMGLRQFREECPSCGGDLVSRPESTDSCCWSRDATTMRCVACASRLYAVAE